MTSGQVDFSSPAEAVGSDFFYKNKYLYPPHNAFMAFSSATGLGVSLVHNSKLCDQFCLDILKLNNLSISCKAHSVRALNSHV